MDCFDRNLQVKVIKATNKPNILVPALMRPERLDRKIEFPFQDWRRKRLIFQVITNKMNLTEDIDLEKFINRPEKISVVDVASISQEAGLLAIRKSRYVVIHKILKKLIKM